MEKVTVWRMLARNGIIRPYWFKHADGRPVTVNTEWYIELMRGKFIPALRWKRAVDMDTVIYPRMDQYRTAPMVDSNTPSLLPWRHAYLL